jgi:hypothetical protein
MSSIALAESVMPARSGHSAGGSSKDERTAQQELQKLKERKLAVGPSLESAGWASLTMRTSRRSLRVKARVLRANDHTDERAQKALELV